jgi:hypothetical protein
VDRAPDAQGLAEGAVYVYGVVTADAEPALEGAPSVEEGRPVELVAAPPVGVLVSRVSPALFADANGEPGSDLAWLEAPVRAHQEVLERALAAGPVIPMRFGTVVSDEDALVAYVAERREGFTAALSDLAGKREWGVKVLADEERLRERMRADAGADEPTARSEGAAYLARKRTERLVAERLEADAAATAEQIHAALAAHAERAARLTQTLAPPDERRRVLLNGAYLVDAERDGDFGAAVDDLGRSHAEAGISVTLSGPWPPYSFVSEQ